MNKNININYTVYKKINIVHRKFQTSANVKKIHSKKLFSKTTNGKKQLFIHTHKEKVSSVVIKEALSFQF